MLWRVCVDSPPPLSFTPDPRSWFYLCCLLPNVYSWRGERGGVLMSNNRPRLLFGFVSLSFVRQPFCAWRQFQPMSDRRRFLISSLKIQLFSFLFSDFSWRKKGGQQHQRAVGNSWRFTQWPPPSKIKKKKKEKVPKLFISLFFLLSRSFAWLSIKHAHKTHDTCFLFCLELEWGNFYFIFSFGETIFKILTCLFFCLFFVRCVSH